AHHRLDVGLVGHIRTDPALGRVEVGDHHRRALALEPLGDRPADPLRAAGDDRDLAVERHAHTSRLVTTCCKVVTWSGRTRSAPGSGSTACAAAAAAAGGTPASARLSAARRV